VGGHCFCACRAMRKREACAALLQRTATRNGHEGLSDTPDHTARQQCNIRYGNRFAKLWAKRLSFAHLHVWQTLSRTISNSLWSFTLPHPQGKPYPGNTCTTNRKLHGASREQTAGVQERAQTLKCRAEARREEGGGVQGIETWRGGRGQSLGPLRCPAPFAGEWRPRPRCSPGSLIAPADAPAAQRNSTNSKRAGQRGGSMEEGHKGKGSCAGMTSAGIEKKIFSFVGTQRQSELSSGVSATHAVGVCTLDAKQYHHLPQMQTTATTLPPGRSLYCFMSQGGGRTVLPRKTCPGTGSRRNWKAPGSLACTTQRTTRGTGGFKIQSPFSECLVFWHIRGQSQVQACHGHTNETQLLCQNQRVACWPPIPD